MFSTAKELWRAMAKAAKVVSSWIEDWANAMSAPAAPTWRQAQRWAMPRLLCLEERAVPADLLFIGGPNASWSVGANWVDLGTTKKAAGVAAGDVLILNPNYGQVGGFTPTNNPSKADLDVAINQLIVDSSYNQNITFDKDLTIRAVLDYRPGVGSQLSDGAAAGTQKLKVDPLGGNAIVTWGGGTTATVSVDFAVGTTSTLQGAGAKTFDAGLNNDGTLNWTDGNIVAGFDIINTGTFDIKCDRSITVVPQTNPLLLNSGTFKKSAAVLTTTINTSFNNLGQFELTAGTVSLTAGGLQTVVVTSTTQLGPGTVLQVSGGNYVVNAGAFYGHGATFIGTLQMGGTSKIGAQTSGANPQPSTLTIRGSYVQGADVIMIVRASRPQNQNIYSLIDVRPIVPGGAGGTATLSGKVQFIQDAAAPPAATGPVGAAFLRYTTRVGAFSDWNWNWIAWANPVPGGPATLSFVGYSPNIVATEYRLFIA